MRARSPEPIFSARTFIDSIFVMAGFSGLGASAVDCAKHAQVMISDIANWPNIDLLRITSSFSALPVRLRSTDAAPATPGQGIVHSIRQETGGNSQKPAGML